ncbi:SRPBCC domain-containing protein [Dyadobacter luteus]|uniref:SRPBCC domain-containing protein n=1 Tax=Dyadobacter luteus TaxID=2259619 RepID=A0A3D8YH03_9BACT|nr:SRPBCC domain-containing protein [Dyadobacter luteus]REA64082.1 SRPBCC domain-containing protein [Dyadobacter luteus]
MNRKLVATTSTAIHASPADIWQALVEPSMISQYLHGTHAESEWKVGSPITFTSEWQGKSYIDKGTILEINPERVLSYSYWSSMSGTDDYEDNYAHVTYHISHYDDESTLTITQDNLETDEDVVKAEENWMIVAGKIKSLTEKSTHSTH